MNTYYNNNYIYIFTEIMRFFDIIFYIRVTELYFLSKNQYEI